MGEDHRPLTESMARLIAENTGLRQELGEMRLRLEELERLADSDTLTPLPNRRFFIRELMRVIRHAERYGLPAAVMYVDLNDLKRINDSAGHSAGDAALIHTAMLLRRELRSTDVVARIGGDEFGLILDHLDQRAAEMKAMALVRRIQDEPMQFIDRSIAISVSIGFTMVRPGDHVDAVLTRADSQMYLAKQSAERADQLGLPLDCGQQRSGERHRPDDQA